MGSSWTGDLTCVPFTARQILSPRTTREAPSLFAEPSICEAGELTLEGAHCEPRAWAPSSVASGTGCPNAPPGRRLKIRVCLTKEEIPLVIRGVSAPETWAASRVPSNSKRPLFLWWDRTPRLPQSLLCCESASFLLIFGTHQGNHLAFCAPHTREAPTS